MKNTSKRAGIVAAVLLAAGLGGACPGTAFADTASNQAPTSSFTSSTAVTHHADRDQVHSDQRTDRDREHGWDRGWDRDRDRDRGWAHSWDRGRGREHGWDRDHGRLILGRYDRAHHFAHPAGPRGWIGRWNR